MPLNRTKRAFRKAAKRRPARDDPSESRAAEVWTIAWTVSVTGVTLADLMAAVAHWFANWSPDAAAPRFLAAILLLSAAGMGVVSLILLPIAWRRRRLKPPLGFAVFAVVVAAAPIVALLVRFLA
jgi:hypothetical protein